MGHAFIPVVGEGFIGIVGERIGKEGGEVVVVDGEGTGVKNGVGLFFASVVIKGSLSFGIFGLPYQEKMRSVPTVIKSTTTTNPKNHLSFLLSSLCCGGEISDELIV